VQRIVFLLLPRVHLLDLSGPAQVFSTASDLGYRYRLSYVGEHDGVMTAQGLPLCTGTSWPALTANDLVLVPGCETRNLADSYRICESTAQRLRNHHAAGGSVATVCSGADVAGQAGLLDGRRCTTHHDLQDEFAERYPRATVVRDVLFVVDDRVITSAGVASGIDLALHLVAMRHGAGAAARVARAMVVYARRNGNEQQISAVLRNRAHLNDVVHRVQDLIDARFAERLPLADLATASGCSVRTLTRLFTGATGLTPLRYQHEIRIERAQHLIGQGATMEAAAHAVGFGDARMLRRLRARL
jgi:transcriptional regulator GlxA family with amidase domain